ncbi:sensor histidine kinase [Hymenobacter baengnokdamensis]|uniref:sensor histidine kinase n=1 Tax=Hymenobacter baengnokdamensis TaxID=2615203 RepID=UPI00177F8671|nr:ATP-binding protein [Hymenobacter baengnokdamensis]
MNLRLNAKISLGFAIALSVLMATSITAYVAIQQLSVYTRLVEHSYQVLQQTSDLRLNIRDAQSSVRNYLLLADTAYLSTYRHNATFMQAEVQKLAQLVADDAPQRARADSLRRFVDVQLRELATFRTFSPTTPAAQSLLLREQPPLHTLQGLMRRIRLYEDNLLRKRNHQQSLFQKLAPSAIIASAILAVIIVLGLFHKIVRELQANDDLRLALTRTNLDTAQRIRAMEHLARQVVQGDYKAKLTNAGQQQDRLASLATLLNQMTQALDTAFGALENRNKELDQFAYVASHDLKAPLRGLSTIVKWIEQELAAELSPQLRGYLDQMKGRLSRLDDLINGLLAYARASRAERQLEPVDVAQLVREVAELVVPPSFELVLAPGLPTFVTDRLSLQQVFTNLLSNAVKHYSGPGPGRVEVASQDLGTQYEFRVQDNGPGIAPEHHQKIFLLFQTLRDRHTAESTGIGLSIVKKLLDDQQGSIRVESAVGQGAAFSFTWPKNER